MPIFNISKNGDLVQIIEKNFLIEKDIQKIAERNIETIFNLKFIASEYVLHNLRLDSLCFDTETSSFVIIEYKKDRNFSVIDQGYAYLSLLLNNKAEFILLYNENNKDNKTIKKNDVDWSQSKVIFVSPNFTNYQRKAIEFKDLPIELWEVKLYSNNTILFNQIQSPEKSESITTISQRSEVVKQVSKEVRTYDEEHHFQHASDKTKSIYNELKNTILSISNDVSFKPMKMYIAFVRKSNFIYIVLKKSHLIIFINMRKGSLVDPKNIARDVSSIGHWGHGDYEIKLADSTDLGYIMTLIKQSYDKN
jgi:predicted transport protein